MSEHVPVAIAAVSSIVMLGLALYANAVYG